MAKEFYLKEEEWVLEFVIFCPVSCCYSISNVLCFLSMLYLIVYSLLDQNGQEVSLVSSMDVKVPHYIHLASHICWPLPRALLDKTTGVTCWTCLGCYHQMLTGLDVSNLSLTMCGGRCVAMFLSLISCHLRTLTPLYVYVIVSVKTWLDSHIFSFFPQHSGRIY